MYVSMYLFRVTITPEIPQVILTSCHCRFERLTVMCRQYWKHSKERPVFSQEAPLWVQLLHPISVLIGVSEKEVNSDISGHQNLMCWKRRKLSRTLFRIFILSCSDLDPPPRCRLWVFLLRTHRLVWGDSQWECTFKFLRNVSRCRGTNGEW